jgi:hypothetical protein
MSILGLTISYRIIEKHPHFVIPAPAFARVNSGGNPEGIERTGFLLSQE